MLAKIFLQFDSKTFFFKLSRDLGEQIAVDQKLGICCLGKSPWVQLLPVSLGTNSRCLQLISITTRQGKLDPFIVDLT